MVSIEILSDFCRDSQLSLLVFSLISIEILPNFCLDSL